ncbi:MAG TPA: HAMP domain-containing sensor histidine kinase [Polyangiaceae bacterium]|nr:HAMP domain-containing sensor histidine kinase [Polyangiaceae bacterium]
MLRSVVGQSPPDAHDPGAGDRPSSSEARTNRSGAPASADYNLRILWPLARWLEEHRGDQALAQVLDGTGLSRSDFESKREWVSAATFEAIVARARALVPDDETFMRACAYRLAEAYGPIRYVLWATSPAAVYAQMVKTYRLVSVVGTLTCVSHEGTRFHMRVDPAGRAISRLTCLVRQANLRAMPTLWGLPAAHVKEDACVGLGDATCELHMRWYATRSALPVIGGALLFGAVEVVLSRLGLASTVMAPLFCLLGAALGYVVEGQRTERINHSTREEVMDALRELASEEAEARREMIELNRRQKEWTRLVEEQMGERTLALERVVAGMQDLQQERVSRVLGFSHDLRNPLQIIQFGAEVLRQRCESDDSLRGVVDDMDYAVGQMKRMLAELVKTANGQRRAAMQFAPQRMAIRELTDSLQRRLRALVYGRDVRANVFGTREAPESIEIDPLLFDRIVDNLLTNAAKYTERGSIVVELDGHPGFLVLKVADTGCGIEPEAMDRIFQPGGSTPESRRGDSFGVGLSVVVQLLDQIGGRLEIMSRPGDGTTFWVHLPLNASEPRTISSHVAGSDLRAPLSRVVRIRSLTA